MLTIDRYAETCTLRRDAARMGEEIDRMCDTIHELRAEAADLRRQLAKAEREAFEADVRATEYGELLYEMGYAGWYGSFDRYDMGQEVRDAVQRVDKRITERIERGPDSDG